MASRERLEDLGRIAEILNQITDHDLFNLYDGRNKDFTCWFDEQIEEKREDFLHNMIYALSDVQDKICDAYNVARWGDAGDDEEE